MLSENILTQLICLRYLSVPSNAAIKKYLTSLESNFQKEEIPIPSLKQICKFTILQKCDTKNSKNLKKELKNWNLWEVEC